eukprot:scaffold7419_cov137-Isochrysis_galbana.AAC.1
MLESRVSSFRSSFALALYSLSSFLLSKASLILASKKNSASAWRVTMMAPRQLQLEPIEVDSAADKGAN